MDTTPTQIFVDTTDDPRWTEGKALMPTITKETFLQQRNQNHGAYVIVPNKYKGYRTKRVGTLIPIIER